MGQTGMIRSQTGGSVFVNIFSHPARLLGLVLVGALALSAQEPPPGLEEISKEPDMILAPTNELGWGFLDASSSSNGCKPSESCVPACPYKINWIRGECLSTWDSCKGIYPVYCTCTADQNHWDNKKHTTDQSKY